MSVKKRLVLFFPLTIVFAGVLSFVVLSFAPNTSLSIPYTSYSFPSLYLFFLLSFLLLFTFTALILNTRRALLLALFTESVLLLLINHLNQPFFILLLGALFIILELLFSKQTKTNKK